MKRILLFGDVAEMGTDEEIEAIILASEAEQAEIEAEVEEDGKIQREYDETCEKMAKRGTKKLIKFN